MHPELTKKWGIAGQAYAFELSLADLTKGNVPSFKVLSKFPQVRRDVAIVLDEAVGSQAVIDIVKANGGEQLVNTSVFDVYQGQGVPEGQKSLAVAMIFQHQERSLNDEEIQSTVDATVSALSTKLGASLR